MKQIDARGLSCPQPVVLVKKAIDEGPEDMEILLNSEVSRENVIRILNKHNMKFKVSAQGDDIIVAVSK